jgi:hypothetical protein
MKLGILVNTDKHPGTVAGLTKAALDRGHEVIIFTMDEGTKLFGNPSYAGLSRLDGVRMSFCSHNAEGCGVATEGLPEEIVCGSQFDNASMNHEADKVIVL